MDWLVSPAQSDPEPVSCTALTPGFDVSAIQWTWFPACWFIDQPSGLNTPERNAGLGTRLRAPSAPSAPMDTPTIPTTATTNLAVPITTQDLLCFTKTSFYSNGPSNGTSDQKKNKPALLPTSRRETSRAGPLTRSLALGFSIPDLSRALVAYPLRWLLGKEPARTDLHRALVSRSVHGVKGFPAGFPASHRKTLP